MYIFDLTNPVTLVLLTAATALLIFLGKEIKKPFVPALALVFYLVLIYIRFSICSAEISSLSKALDKRTAKSLHFPHNEFLAHARFKVN